MNTPNLKTADVLVTGGHGFVGSHLLEALRSRGVSKITAPSHKECDLREPKAVQALFKSKRFDVVFHLAASVGGIGANQKRPADFFYDNMLMGMNLIDAACRAGVGRFIQMGTICAYPKFAPVPFREESMWDGYPEETNAPYGVAKRSLMVAAEAYRAQYGFRYVGVFPTNLYGPSDDFDLDTSHVIPALIRKCEEAIRSKRGKITLWGSGTPSRDFLYVTDAVMGLIAAAEHPSAEGHIFNLGSEREVTIRDLADLIGRQTGFKGTYEWDSDKPDGQPRRCVSGDKALRLLGYKPGVSLEEGIGKTIQWFREEYLRLKT